MDSGLSNEYLEHYTQAGCVLNFNVCGAVIFLFPGTVISVFLGKVVMTKMVKQKPILVVC